MTADTLAEMRELIGKEQYHEVAEFAGRARLRLDVVRLGRERQPPLLG